MRPLIGLTPAIVEREWAGGLSMPAALAWSSYLRAIAAAGGVPVILATEGHGVEEALAVLHGLVLPGGADLAPALYGEAEVHPKVYGVNAARDDFEIALVRAALARDLPLLAICRGIQVLNVALGGTLYQDVDDGRPESIDHSQTTAPHAGWHPVRLAPGSCLALAYGAEEVAVNSFHHQAVRAVAPGLTPVGWSADGLIEGLESPGHAFAVGLQWHPEAMFEASPEHLGPFLALVEQAVAYRDRRAVAASA